MFQLDVGLTRHTEYYLTIESSNVQIVTEYITSATPKTMQTICTLLSCVAASAKDFCMIVCILFSAGSSTLVWVYDLGVHVSFHFMWTTTTSRTSSKFGQIGPRTAELATVERLEKSPQAYNWTNVVTTLAPSFLIELSSFLQVTRTCIKAWMSSNFG